jgi:hypothetical protein
MKFLCKSIKIKLKMKYNIEVIGLTTKKDLVLDIVKIFEKQENEFSKIFKFSINEDCKIKLYTSSKTLKDKVAVNSTELAIFCKNEIGKKEVHILHPNNANIMFKNDNLEKRFDEFISYGLFKIFLYEKYLKENKSFSKYEKLICENLSKLLSGYFQKEIIEFDIKNYSKDKFVLPKKLINIVFYIILSESKKEFILSNLDEIFEEESIEKLVEKIYKKDLFEFINPFKEKILNYDKEMQIKKNR